MTLEGRQPTRPSTSQLTIAVLRAADGQVREVVITAQADSTLFHASVVLTNGASVDARPSDALNLALLVAVVVVRLCLVHRLTLPPIRGLVSAPAGGCP